MRRWIDMLFGTHPPERTTTDAAPDRDPGIEMARRRYEREKQAAMQKQIDLLARLNRLGYDVANATRKDIDDAANRHH